MSKNSPPEMNLSSEEKAGLYFTVSLHLVVVIFLLILQINSFVSRGEVFMLDFSKDNDVSLEETRNRIKEEQEYFDEMIASRIEKLISGQSGQSFRNTATDRTQALKDDRGTDANQLYQDAQRLAPELKNGVHIDDEPEYADPDPGKKEEEHRGEYSGPSVVSYSLDGRKASRLPIPAYRCYAGGMVTVLIVVDNAGNVVEAKVQDATSSKDKCLREFAVRAAKMSHFSRDTKAPLNHRGDIIYQFIAQ